MSRERIINITFDIITRASTYPKSTALIVENQTISYKELDETIWKTANFLRENGIKAGDVIGIHAKSDLNIVISMLGIARLGATVFSLPKSASLGQVNEMIRRANIKKILIDHKTPIRDRSCIFFSINSLPSQLPKKENIIDYSPTSPWIIITGSGTTGRPKFIPIDHHTQRIRNEMSDEWLGLTPYDRVASLSHFDFTHPKNRLLETLQKGAAYIIPSSKKSMQELCATYDLTVLHATVFHIQKLINTLTPNRSKILENIRVLAISASTVNHSLRLKIREQITSNLVVRYACNETGTISFAKSPEVFEIEGTVGRCLKNVSVEVLGSTHGTQSSSCEGMISVSSPATFSGYLDDAQSTASQCTPNGFMPNDIIRVDKAGNLFFLGRSDQMMIFNGINIYPSEIEQILSTHDAISDVTSFPISHPVHQDIPTAAVSLRPNARTSENELLEYCASRLGSHRPHKIFIIQQIPRNERGKVTRSDLIKAVKDKYGR